MTLKIRDKWNQKSVCSIFKNLLCPLHGTGWIHLPQEVEGNYWFSGHFYVTAGVQAMLNTGEILMIYLETQSLVQQQQGLDYLQVFVRQVDNLKLFFIDQLTEVQVEGGEFDPEYNYCTLMLASEY